MSFDWSKIKKGIKKEPCLCTPFSDICVYCEEKKEMKKNES